VTRIRKQRHAISFFYYASPIYGGSSPLGVARVEVQWKCFERSGKVSTTRKKAGNAVWRLIYPVRADNSTSNSGGDRARAYSSQLQLGQPYFLMQGAGDSDDADRLKAPLL
jgi:hypothetical protein